MRINATAHMAGRGAFGLGSACLAMTLCAICLVCGHCVAAADMTVSVVDSAGPGVDFPNSHQIHHQVYSFSAPKSFKLSLYAGHKYAPIVFDRPGLVTLGCNIHDGMIGYISVHNAPFFGRSDESGQLQLHGLPPGNYTLTAWHPQMQEPGDNTLRLHVALAESEHSNPVFDLTHPLRTEMTHDGDKRWTDYCPLWCSRACCWPRRWSRHPTSMPRSIFAGSSPTACLHI